MDMLFQGLRNFEEHKVSLAALGVVGDLARNFGNKILPYCDDILTILLEGLIVIITYFLLIPTGFDYFFVFKRVQN